MKIKINYLALILFSLILVVVFIPGFNARAAVFNPNFIISDEEMLDFTTMTLTDIEIFLRNKGGYLARYTTLNADGVRKTAAQIIYDAAVNNYDCDDAGNISDEPSVAEKKLKCTPVKINPQLLLVLLQKEQSLVEEVSPTTRQLDWATGYGCPDNQACNDRWRGFGKQVNSAALQFFDYLKNPHHYTYKAGNTYSITSTDHPDAQVTPANNATAALYNYTPHVYWGNFNFYKLWMRFFTFSYPNGSLLQAKGEPGVWLIKDGKKRPFLTRGALTTRFDLNKVIQVNKSELDRYVKGAPIRFPQYSLIRSPRGTIYLLIDDKRRGFTSAEAFRKIGYNPEEVMDASWEDINAYTEGSSISTTTTYATGALLQDKTSGGVYWVTDGTKAPLWDAVLLKTKYKGRSITPETSEKLASYTTIDPAIFSDGELLKSDASPAVYVIDNKKKRAMTSGKIFETLGYSWDNIITVPPKILNLYETGDSISEVYTEEDADVQTATSSNETLDEEIQDILNP